MKRMTCFLPLLLLLMADNSGAEFRSLDSFKTGAACYNRETEAYTAVVDTHLHYRPFDGRAIPFQQVNDYLRKTSVRFANIYGIGQMLPALSTCQDYLKCPGTPVLPTTRNDMVNAANLIEHTPSDLHLTLSMTFTDLSNPESTLDIMRLYDREYPGLFRWMGEVNLVKQAQFNNHHLAATPENINLWADFMVELAQRDMPITIHADLGTQSNPTLYLPLMEQALTLYPDNKIIWAHMGISYEQLNVSAEQHIDILSSLLSTFPNLYLDISWRVLEDHYFSKKGNRAQYVAFLNRFSDRILPGSDFVAFRNNRFEIYQQELEVTGRIHQYLSDEAFRNIALGQNYFDLLNLQYVAPLVCRQ